MADASESKGMTDEDLLKYYLGIHDAEFKWRDSINSSLTPFITVLVLLVGAELFYARSATPFPVGCWYVAFVSVMVLAGAFLIFAIGYLSAALWGHEYAYVQPPKVVEEWCRANSEYHVAFPNEKPTFAERLQAEIVSQVASSASHNRTINRSKSELAYRARLCTLISLVCLAVGLVPYSVLTREAPTAVEKPDSRSTREKTQKEIGIMSDDKNSTQQSSGSQGSGEAKPAPVKTTLPAPELIREGSEKQNHGTLVNEQTRTKHD